MSAKASALKSTNKKTTKAASTKTTKSEKVSTKELKTTGSKKETLKISVKAFEHRVVDEAVKKIVKSCRRIQVTNCRTYPTPNKDRKIHSQPINICQ